MTTEGWIFMIGFRVFDVGLLVVWLIWFFRLRDDGDDPSGEDGGGGSGPRRGPRDGGPGGGLERFGPGRARPSRRLRDHSPPPPAGRRRGAGSPFPRPLPARVRLPAGPAPLRRAGL